MHPSIPKSHEASVAVWAPCPMCWGQGRIYEPIPEGLLATICETCLGVGQGLTLEPAPAPRRPRLRAALPRRNVAP